MIPLSQMAAAGQRPVAPGPTASPEQTRLAALVPQPQLPQVPQSANPIEQAYFERLTNDYPGLVAQYAQEPESEGGKIINTDIAREMSPEYKDHPKVKIQVIDNSRGPGKAMLSSLDKLPKLDENAIRKGLQDALEQAHRTGAISPAIYRGTADYAR